MCQLILTKSENRYKWNKATLTHILTWQEYCGDVANFKTAKHSRDKRNHYVDRQTAYTARESGAGGNGEILQG